MSQLTKNDLIDFTADTACITKRAAGEIVTNLFNRITSALDDGQEVTIHGFGKFSTKKRAARTGRNPATGESIDIPERWSAKFKASKTLDDGLND